MTDDNNDIFSGFSSGKDEAFEEFLRSIDEPDGEQPASGGQSSGLDDSDVISDEELAKLLGMSSEEFKTVEASVDDNTHVYKDGLPLEARADEDKAARRAKLEATTRIESVAGLKKDTAPSESENSRPNKRAVPEAPAEKPRASAENEGVNRAVYRRKNKRMGCMGGFLYFIMILCISAVLAAVAWVAANDVLSLNKPEAKATIVVAENFTIDEVASSLKSGGIIQYPILFKIFAGFSDAAEKIDPGEYELSSQLDYRAIVTHLQRGAGEAVTTKLTIPEGKTMKQTFELLEEANVCTVAELEEYAKNGELNYDFLSPDKLGSETRLEGFLFPDTYEFYEEASAKYTLEKFLDNFKRRITEEMYAQAAEMGRSFDDILTVASMIEMEAASDAERPRIASVIYNRLESSSFGYLQIDATVQYALAERKDKLTYDDLEVDSPYNTYTHKGLPPGPIANPGLASIKAALNPEDTSYYYYALRKDGSHKFFTNYSEFEAFVESSDFGG